MTELRAKAGMPARALEFLILIAARRDEVRLAPWSEIDQAGPGLDRSVGEDEDRPRASGAAQ